MVYKQVRSKKTPNGYSVWVNFREGRHVKPLVHIINLYFIEIDKVENPERTKQLLLDAEREISALEKAKVLR